MTTVLADRARRAARSWRDTAELRVFHGSGRRGIGTVRYLMHVLMPAWFLPGIADYLMHRHWRLRPRSRLPAGTSPASRPASPA